MRKITERILPLILALAMLIMTVPAYGAGAFTDESVCVDGGKHNIIQVEAKKPSYTENGWEAQEYCTNVECSYSTFVAIPALGEPEINDYEDFVYNLNLLEMLAYEYSLTNPGNDPLELVIKYVRTGVDRYNSGSWGIMAGYENADFANFVRRK